VKVFYTDQFVLSLPPDHRFPISKYARLRERVQAAGLWEMIVPAAATDAQLTLAHDVEYVRRIRAGAMTEREMRRIGFPWSPALVERSTRSVGATIAAARAALDDGLAANLAGGTHHAYPDHGEGYCVFNDVAVAARVLQREGRAGRVVVIDLDVHQGNGTAAIFAGDDSVFTFSVHGAKNFPFHKEPSSLDLALPDGAGDDEFLAAVEDGTRRALAACGAHVAFYLAGADPFAGDRLGRLAVSKAALAERDRIVLGQCRAAGLPVVITMAGGYGRDVHDTVDIHYETLLTARELG
jgi:acetoin utilization deacetylase AcuC-like enzyme